MEKKSKEIFVKNISFIKTGSLEINMKPIKPLKFKLDNKYVKIEFETEYSKGMYDIHYETYLVYIKKFQKLMKDCTILNLQVYEK